MPKVYCKKIKTIKMRKANSKTKLIKKIWWRDYGE